MATRKFLYVDANGDYIESTGAFEASDFIDTSAGAGDAGKPVILDADGKIDSTMIDSTDVDHGQLQGLLDDDHTQYILVDGTRAFTGDQSMGSNKLTNLATPTAAGDATNKSYVDSVAVGLRPKGNVAVATTANIVLSGLQTIDTYSVQSGDRVLVKDQTDPTENGIYVAAAGAWTRSEDQDNSPLAEILNGVFIPKILNGSANLDKPYFISSVGTGTDDVHQIGVDDIIWEEFTSPSQLTAGNGIDITANVVSVDIVDADSGLKFVGTELAVEPNDFAGDGLIDDGSDNLAIDFATTFTIDAADSKAFRASDLASTTTGEGASIVGIEDASAYYTGTDLETVLNEIESQLGGTTSTTYNFTEDNVLADNDSVYPALNKLDLKWGDLASTTNGEGASLVGIEDAGGVFTSTNVEGALDELYELASVSTGETALADTGGVTKGDLLEYSANNTVAPLDITTGNRAVGVALNTASVGQEVKYARWDELVDGILVGATFGDAYYWNGTTLVTTIPPGSGQYVWRVGVAKNTTDLLATVEFIRRNSI